VSGRPTGCGLRPGRRVPRSVRGAPRHQYHLPKRPEGRDEKYLLVGHKPTERGSPRSTRLGIQHERVPASYSSSRTEVENGGGPSARRLDPAIGQELAVWGFNLEPPPEFAPLPLATASGVTGALPEEQSSASPVPVEETASLPPAAASVPPPTPQNGLSNSPPTPVQQTQSLPLPAEVAESAHQARRRAPDHR
jgi:hypothetical protein